MWIIPFLILLYGTSYKRAITLGSLSIYELEVAGKRKKMCVRDK
jgi:hypothetical protein